MLFHSAYTQKKSHEGNVAKSYAWDNINLPNPNIKPSINNPIQNLSFDRIMYLTVKNYATVEQEYLTWYIYSISYLKFIWQLKKIIVICIIFINILIDL